MKFNDFEDIYGKAEQGDGREGKGKGMRRGTGGRVLPHFKLLSLPVACVPFRLQLSSILLPLPGFASSGTREMELETGILLWSRSGKDAFLL